MYLWSEMVELMPCGISVIYCNNKLVEEAFRVGLEVLGNFFRARALKLALNESRELLALVDFLGEGHSRRELR